MKNKVVELFAGVGGFRVGFNNVKSLTHSGTAIENQHFDFVWANQWEPGSKTQHAFDCYTKRFGSSNSHVCQDITTVDKSLIPDHDILVGGFPCQDYSVARSLSGEKGIEGKKGVLWWEIYKTLIAKHPRFVFLENVDRLVKSPSKQRGRDFGIMLASLTQLGYIVEWRIINAADYGNPQRRRRVYIFAYMKDTTFAKSFEPYTPYEIIQKNGVFATNFHISDFNPTEVRSHYFETLDLVELTKKFRFNFDNTGYCTSKTIYTVKTVPVVEKPVLLKQILEANVANPQYYVTTEKLSKWKYLKGPKKIQRTSKTGLSYMYSEGAISFPDDLNKPGRTMLTSEGTLNRSSHLILDPISGLYRILTPVEAERLNGFPDNWTDTMPNRKRYFMMGNALVVDVVGRIGKYLKDK